jgi:hypothetical protein
MKILSITSADLLLGSVQYEEPVGMPNSALATYRDPVSAQKALDASPIRFSLEAIAGDGAENDVDESRSEDQPEDGGASMQSQSGEDGVEEIIRPSTLLYRPSDPNSDHFTSATRQTKVHTPPENQLQENTKDEKVAGTGQSEKPSKTLRWFHLTVDLLRTDQREYVERQPLYNTFAPTKSMAQEDLAKSVPHVGLSDVSVRHKSARTPNRILNKQAKAMADRKTLKQMWEETRASLSGSGFTDKTETEGRRY